jgi:imidazoleglycerol phosphate dehydratase HisB
LGQAFDKALGDRKGIVRMGDCFAPMDETLAHVAIDLSGRPYAVIHADWHSPYVGNIPTTLFPHFDRRGNSALIYTLVFCMAVTIIKLRRCPPGRVRSIK